MSEIFAAEFFAGNRRCLREQVKPDVPIVVAANGLLQRGGDSTFPFQQDASFWYLTGIDEPDVLLVMNGDDDYLIVPSRNAVREAFDGALDFAELKKISGVRDVVDGQTGWRYLKDKLGASKQVATLEAAPSFIEQAGFYTNPARTQLIRRLKKINPKLELLDLRPQLARMRMVKQPAELKAIQAAIDVTAETLQVVRAQISEYSYEYEIEADITRGFRTRGAAGHAFAPIVASGKHGCTLHNVANNGKLSPKDLVVLDVGAEVSHYAADITRTVSLSGKPSARQKQVHDAVKEVQEFAFGLQKPGALMKDNEKKIEKFMGEKLRELGLIKTITTKDVRKYYPHSTSHFLGLDVHDAGDYQAPLEAGTVLTVEPGIYIPDEGIGVRIEDDVLITDKGMEVLSEWLPRALV